MGREGRVIRAKRSMGKVGSLQAEVRVELVNVFIEKLGSKVCGLIKQWEQISCEMDNSYGCCKDFTFI